VHVCRHSGVAVCVCQGSLSRKLISKKQTKQEADAEQGHDMVFAPHHTHGASAPTTPFHDTQQAEGGGGDGGMGGGEDERMGGDDGETTSEQLGKVQSNFEVGPLKQCEPLCVCRCVCVCVCVCFE
jgi:hypothetical protein